MKYIVKICALVALAGCSGANGGGSDDYAALSLTPEGDHFIARGTIDDTTPDVIRDALDGNPDIKKIVLQFIPGSADDESNLEASRLIRENGITTVVPEGGFVASGGTDMFLAGASRDIKSGACIGVHSWATGDGTEGKDVPRDDSQHQLYLNYYDEMGITPDFYWFTLQAAPAQGMHYMSNAEITQYGMATSSIAENEEATAARCEEIGAEAEEG